MASQPENVYYVYMLVDSRDNKPFYIGKGTGFRYEAHVNEANKTSDDDSKESDKLKRIKEIEKNGGQVKHFIVRWNLTEQEAFAVEAALIDYSKYLGYELTNIQSGHDHLHGIKPIKYNI